MKTIYLLVHRLIRYIKKDKIIITLFVLGGIVNSVVFAYFYGNIIPSVVNRNSMEIQYRWYRVSLEEDFSTDFLKVKIKNLQKSKLIESVVLGYEIPVQGDFPRIVCASLDGDIPIVTMKGTSKITKNGQILVPFDEKQPVGTEKELQGRTYTIVGQHTGDEYFISAEDYYRDWNMLNRLYVLSAQKQSYRHDSVESLLRESFPGMYIRTPKGYETDDEGKSTLEICLTCMVYLVSSASFVFLLRYLIDSMMVENTVSLIVGAPKGKIITMIFWEQLLLFLISNVVGLLIHYALTPIFFSKINIVEDFVYTIRDYATILLLMFFLNTVSLIPGLRKYRKMSPVAIGRNHL